MGRYDSHKNPFATMMNSWVHRRINEAVESMAKSIPCHVQQIEKDFTHVAFETKNSIFTPPVMKMTQSFSRFGREATQKKDMGVAVPGNYYLGGNTAYSGGATNFYPRGNLSTLSFQPLANLNAPQRDYDQHWETGGPHGWKVKWQEKQQESAGTSGFGDGGGGGNGGGNGGDGAGVGPTAQVRRAHLRVMQQRIAPTTMARVTPFATGNGSGSNGNGGDQQSQDQQDQQDKQNKTELSFDKESKVLLRSKDEKHYLFIDQKNKTMEGKTEKQITFEAKETGDYIGKKDANLKSDETCTVDPGGGVVYLGGDKKKKYCKVMTTCGPSMNVYARVG